VLGKNTKVREVRDYNTVETRYCL